MSVWLCILVPESTIVCYYNIYALMYEVILKNTCILYSNRTMYEATDDRYCAELWNTTTSGLVQEAPKAYQVFSTLTLWIMSALGIAIEVSWLGDDEIWNCRKTLLWSTLMFVCYYCRLDRYTARRPGTWGVAQIYSTGLVTSQSP